MKPTAKTAASEIFSLIGILSCTNRNMGKQVTNKSVVKLKMTEYIGRIPSSQQVYSLGRRGLTKLN